MTAGNKSFDVVRTGIPYDLPIEGSKMFRERSGSSSIGFTFGVDERKNSFTSKSSASSLDPIKEESSSPIGSHIEANEL